MKKTISALLVFTLIIVSTVMAFSQPIGDVNSDGNVNATDALCVLQYAVGMDPQNFNIDRADITNDGNINSSDALIILMIAVGSYIPESTTQIGVITSPSPQSPVLSYSKTQLIEYYNSCLEYSYTFNVDATKTEQVDVQVSGIDIGNLNLDVDKFAQNIIANNTRNNGVVQTKTFANGIAIDDNSSIEKFILPTNLYDEAVKSINVQPYSSGYKMVIVLNSELCEHTETAEYNASCTWPLDINVIDFGSAVTIEECQLNYPGTTLTATIDEHGRVTGVRTEMPLTVSNAKAKTMGINITVGSINGKWTCVNTMAFSEPGSNNSSSGTIRPSITTTTTTKSVQQQLDEIKDRWGDVIKPTIDADGNITVESVDGTDTGLFGFKYSTRDKCFIIAEDAWQRNFGYNQTYDDTSAAIAITYDTMRVYFTHDGLEWMIQYWKGQYGMVLVGAEIGTYNRPVGSTASSHYDCASDQLKMLQSMDVYRRESSTSSKYTKIFSRSPAYTWWCAGFIPGTLGAGKYNVTAQETAMLRVDSKLTLHSPEMAQAFMQGLREVSKVEYNGASRQVRNINMTEYATVAEYEAATGISHKFCLEEDGVTVRVCWR